MSDDSGTIGGALVVGFALFVWTVCILTGSCNISESDSRRTLQHEGISNVQLNGYAWFGCDSRDTFSMRFQGNKNGQAVEGALCSGWLKDITVRYK